MQTFIAYSGLLTGMVLIGVSINLGMESDDEPKSAPSPTPAVYYTLPTGISIVGDTGSSLGDAVYNGVSINQIRHINGGLIVSESLFSNMDGAFKNLVENSGNIQIKSNIYVTSMNGAFSQLQNTDGQLVIDNNLQLRTLGNAFPLVPVIINPSATAFQITSNPQLTTLGTSFNSLRQIFGKIDIRDNPLLQNFEALRNLECHGGIRFNNATEYCENCPTWLIDLPVCNNYPTPAPTTLFPTRSPFTTNPTTSPSSSSPTAAPATPSPTSKPTTSPTYNASEQIIIKDQTIEFGTTGIGVAATDEDIIIQSNNISGSGAAFPHLYHAGGSIAIRNNNFAGQTLFAFPILQEIESMLQIDNNANLQYYDESFDNLQKIGKDDITGGGLVIEGRNSNISLAGAFPSLERIEGHIEIYVPGHHVVGWGNEQSRNAFQSLLCHGGLKPAPEWSLNTNEWCPECPSWFTDLPTCECFDDTDACDESGSGA